jgi:hypothetical protein
MKEVIDIHIWTLIGIMIIMGGFGGYLNLLHNFDTSDDDKKNTVQKYKYVLLGIGSALLIPAFLKMIASDLIKASKPYDNINYLIFAGFCLVAAIFSRKFITSIGDKILEAAKNAELNSKEAKKEVESTKLELTSTKERIEDVKLSVSLNDKNNDIITTENSEEQPTKKLLELVDVYIQKTSISDYSERIKMKAELGRKMGQIIVRNNLNKDELLTQHPKEGMYLALAYSVELRTEKNGLLTLNKLSNVVSQLYTKYVILIAYRTLAGSNLINREEAKEIGEIVERFRINADKSLVRNIEDTLNVLRFIDPEI